MGLRQDAILLLNVDAPLSAAEAIRETPATPPIAFLPTVDL